MQAGNFFRWPFSMPNDILGVRFALNVAIATLIVWYALAHIADTNPIWAIASMVASSDPQVNEAARMFRSRLINVLVGGAVGLVFLVVGGPTELVLPFALAATVLISSYVIHIQTMWRQAPITAAIVIAASLSSHSRVTGIDVQLVAEGETTDLPFEVSLCLFRVAQEGMGNAVRHARAATIRVALRRVKHDVSLTITDHGIGFVASAARSNRFAATAAASRASGQGWTWLFSIVS